MLNKPRYDAIVIGTGFGGAVSACRLSQAGFKVGILERGKRYRMGEFPRNFHDPSGLKDWLWEPDAEDERKFGLIEIKPISEMQIAQCAGFGGGSLIYANVHLRPPADAFAQGWPAEYSRAVLDPYYDLVAYMLDIKPITESKHRKVPGSAPLDHQMEPADDGRPPKTRAMAEVAEALGRGAQFCYPNLALDFGEPGVVHKNKFGVDQKGCVYCGECDIGCNYHAKNTLDLNYLAVAESRGADVSELSEAVKIEPLTGGGYRVTYRDHALDGLERTVEATNIFLCAGSVNSTELLLRCRDQYKTLPNLSGRLGDRYSGNGDFLAFVFNTARSQEPWNGPTITTGVVVDQPVGTGADTQRVWFILEDGGHPPQIAHFLQALNPRYDLLRNTGIILEGDFKAWLAQTARDWMQQVANVGQDVAVFLLMGRDKSRGRIRLHPATCGTFIDWDVRPNLALYDTEEQVLNDVAKALGGSLALNPAWRLLHLPVSVHNLGGCTMADSADDGVTRPTGEVYNYDGLFVLDGAVLPESTGVNPSSTIAAVAERNIEKFIRRRHADWKPDERDAADALARSQDPNRRDPMHSISIPPGGTKPADSPLVGLDFTETMKGFLQPGFMPADNYAGAEKAAKMSNHVAQFTVTIAITNLDEFLQERGHTGIVNGRVYVEGFTDADGAPVNAGVFNLFVQTDQPDTRQMLYALPFLGKDGLPYLLDGFKEVTHRAGFDVWAATTTLYTVLRAGHSHDGAVVATGIIRLHLPDFLKQLTTFRVRGTTDPLRQLQALGKFGEMFMGTLWNLFARPQLAALGWGKTVK
jgi:cholesterol oxidase